MIECSTIDIYITQYSKTLYCQHYAPPWQQMCSNIQFQFQVVMYLPSIYTKGEALDTLSLVIQCEGVTPIKVWIALMNRHLASSATNLELLTERRRPLNLTPPGRMLSSARSKILRRERPETPPDQHALQT